MPTPTLRDRVTDLLNQAEHMGLQPDEVFSIELARPPRPAILHVTRACIRRLEDDGGPLATVTSTLTEAAWRLSRNGVVLLATEKIGIVR